jgi:hypothetical protein
MSCSARYATRGKPWPVLIVAAMLTLSPVLAYSAAAQAPAAPRNLRIDPRALSETPTVPPPADTPAVQTPAADTPGASTPAADTTPAQTPATEPSPTARPADTNIGSSDLTASTPDVSNTGSSTGSGGVGLGLILVVVLIAGGVIVMLMRRAGGPAAETTLTVPDVPVSAPVAEPGQRVPYERAAAAPTTPRAPKIFISYRRDDSADVTGRIYDRLVDKFGERYVFKDVDSIPLGVDFRKHLHKQVAECDIVLAIIGDRWASGAGTIRRLDDEKDFVRIELEAALQRDIPVVPVLVRGGEIPAESELPASLAALAYRNGIPVRPDPDFRRDVDRLIHGIVGHSTSSQPV